MSTFRAAKKILKKYGYPPDKQQKATDTVLDQAKLLCKDWAENGHSNIQQYLYEPSPAYAVAEKDKEYKN